MNKASRRSCTQQKHDGHDGGGTYEVHGEDSDIGGIQQHVADKAHSYCKQRNGYDGP